MKRKQEEISFLATLIVQTYKKYADGEMLNKKPFMVWLQENLECLYDTAYGAGLDKANEMNKNTRNSDDLQSFIQYCTEYPEQRFFQALRNWIGCGFLTADGVDTFYYETVEELRGTLRRLGR